MENIKQPLNLIVIVMYYWSHGMPQNIIVHETETNESTVVDWSNFCQEACQAWVERQQYWQIGDLDENDEPIMVEVDETKYYHRKYHTSLWHAGYWVFGAIERESGKCFLVGIHDRKANTMHAIILPGSHVISRKLFSSYLHEFIFRNALRHTDIFSSFLISLKKFDLSCFTHLRTSLT